MKNKNSKNRSFLKLFSFALSFLGIFLGFSNDIHAQYGVYMAPHKINIKIKSECDEEVEGVKISISRENEKNNVNLPVLHSDKNGNCYITYYSENYYHAPKYIIEAKDIDGDKNGSLKNTLIHLNTKKQEVIVEGPGEARLEDTLYISLAYAGKSPCKEEEKEAKEDTLEIIPANNDTLRILSGENNSGTDKNPFANTDDGLTVFPNPTNSYVIVKYKNDSKQAIMFEMFDIQGKLLWMESRTYRVSNVRKKISMTNYSDGTYILHIKIGDKVFVRRIVYNNY